jgi:Phosphoglycerate dehydrogenase and related dehydrogenases
MEPHIWIIDEEWPDYEVEKTLLNEAFPGCKISCSGYDCMADLNAFGYRADAIICQVYARITAEFIAKLEKCKIISLFGGGFDRIDVKAAAKRNIPVTFVPGYCTEDLADYVMAGIYHFNKSLTSYSGAIKKGLWGAQAVETPVNRIGASKLLIIGVGRIGSAVAGKAKAVGMELLGYDPYVSADKMAELGVQKVELDEGLRLADYVSLNPKYYEGTDSLLSMAEFKKMKPTAYLINTSRGRVMVEKDLIKAVREGVIGGAVLDVVSNEPPKPDDEIFNVPNIIVTPHISYISQQSYRELKQRAAGNVVRALKGERLTDLAINN